MNDLFNAPMCQSDCALCQSDGGLLVLRAANWRVILADEPDYPGFVRVIWNAHVAEMTDLPVAQRAALMEAVWTAERCVREAMQPHKINVAALGNMVPHLHWHVIPRWRDDAHFPAPVWAARQRDVAAAAQAERRERVAALIDLLQSRLV